MITRFAPSPTGPLHLGHAYSALLAHDMARAAGGTFLLRIEDIDQSRARPEWEEQIFDDLGWLGITWDAVPLRQSVRMEAYRAVLDQMYWDRLIYPCSCKRRDILAALSAPQEGAPMGPDGVIYPGTCRTTLEDRDAYPAPAPVDKALRLDWSTYPADLEDGFAFDETGPRHHGQHRFTLEQLQKTVGDVVLARSDMGTSYHLSVVLDDAFQGVTHVVRGADLFDATPIHVALQRLLDLPTPIYHHHKLIRDDNGKRLAKRDDARAVSKYRAEGASPADIREMVGLPLRFAK